MGQTVSPSAPEDIFGYFAEELFEHLPSEEQRILLKLSYLPRMSAVQAEDLTASPEAAGILDRLYRRQLFVHHREGAMPSYQFHALFLAFLRHRAGTILSSPEQMDLMINAARLLEISGDTDLAFEYYLKAQPCEMATRLALDEASTLIAQGRRRTLMERIDARLPQCSPKVLGHCIGVGWRSPTQIPPPRG